MQHPPLAIAAARSLVVGMILYGDVTNDSRVIREARSLASAGHHVVLACLAAGPATAAVLGPGVDVRVVPLRSDVARPGGESPFLAGGGWRLGRLFAQAAWLVRYRANVRAWGRRAIAAVGEADVWHAHDFTGLLAIAGRLPQQVPVIYDSHELFADTGSAGHLPAPVRSLLVREERRLLRRVDAVVTVNPGLASVLAARYPPARPIVVRNCPPLADVAARRDDQLRRAAGILPDAAVVLFHGAITADRGIEQVAAVLERPVFRNVHLVLLGYGERRDAWHERSRMGPLAGRVHVLDAVPPDVLVAWISSADVAAVLQQPVDLNLRLSTPNKLFEAIAAGVPVLASDLPEIARVVQGDPAGPLGELCDPRDEDAIAAALDRLLGLDPAARSALRARCVIAARERLNWEHEVAALLEVYATISALPRR